ncbi:hypothetical protein TNCV_29561 [Trichonephila clavipes]|nr:hypothetical protein TNCV_29561 [Trichonephila clavipes]
MIKAVREAVTGLRRYCNSTQSPVNRWIGDRFFVMASGELLLLIGGVASSGPEDFGCCIKRPGSIPLQSSFLVLGTTPNGGVDGWSSRAAHVLVAAIPNVLQPNAFV